jgi:hypothetical protein
MEKDLRHKLYEMDKDFIVQLCAMEGYSVIHCDITVATTFGAKTNTDLSVKTAVELKTLCAASGFASSGQQLTFRCDFNRNGNFSLFCVSHHDKTVDVKKCPQNRFIRLNFVVDDDVIKERIEYLKNKYEGTQQRKKERD